MMRMQVNDTITAIATPVGEGGIGIVRLSGCDALRIAGELFVSKDGAALASYASYTTHYGHVKDPEGGNGEYVDEVILTVMRAPKSYTKEDIVEVNCHGGPRALKAVLELAVRHGARIAEPGEFTRRAFINGRIDLAQAEAVLDIITAKTDASLKAAVSQLGGGLSKKIEEMRGELSRLLGHMEVAIDFPDEDVRIAEEADLLRALEKVLSEMASLLATADEGIVLREGLLATICGKPNVGKSSLMNLLLKADRVIVTELPGTTRDAVEETLNVKGFPIRIVDTAGISDAGGVLDRAGAERSRRYLEAADIALFVLDGSAPIAREDLAIRDMIKGKKAIVIINKADLHQKISDADAGSLLEGAPVVRLCVSQGLNVGSLEREMLGLLWNGGAFQNEGAIVTHARHKESLVRSAGHVTEALASAKRGLSAEFVAQDLREARYHLGLITGASVSDDILDRIFSEFCIGK